jgi:hypothetical protein
MQWKIFYEQELIATIAKIPPNQKGPITYETNKKGRNFGGLHNQNLEKKIEPQTRWR